MCEYVYILTIFYSANCLGEQSEIKGAYTTEGFAIQAGESLKLEYLDCGYYYYVNKVMVVI